jgi:hypothetical protein
VAKIRRVRLDPSFDLINTLEKKSLKAGKAVTPPPRPALLLVVELLYPL